MTIYAIGDVQGCYDELQALLEKIAFCKNNDTLWFVGDLINRGPKSLETLRFIKNLGTAAQCVLGNHDLHLLAVAYGHKKTHKSDTLDAILKANDCKQLLDWLRHQPLLHHDATLKVTMVHAGIFPNWDFQHAQQYANEVQQILRSDQCDYLLQHLYGDKPTCWSEELHGVERWRFIINAFTRMRYVTEQGCLTMKAKMSVNNAPKTLVPWYDAPKRLLDKHTIVFGHWAALNGVTDHPHAINIDTGCVWGNRLTALTLPSCRRVNVIPIGS